MNTLIVEDEVSDVHQLKQLLFGQQPAFNIVGVTEGVKNTIEWLERNEEPEVIFMNVELPDGQCFDIFNHLSFFLPVVLMSHHEKHALRAIRYNSIDYLLKPLIKEDVERVVSKLRKQSNACISSRKYDIENARILNGRYGIDPYRRRFLVKQGQRLIPIKISDVAYFSSNKSISYIHTTCHRKFHIRFSLDELENMVDPLQYFRVTRNYILSRNIIAAVYPLSNRTIRLELNAPVTAEIIVSKEKSCQVKEWLGG